MSQQISDPGRYFLDLGYQYAEDVKSGKIVACKYVKLAVDRWFRDLETGHERGLVFDENAAAKVFRFTYKYCKHYQGEWDGQPIELSPWQCFINLNVFGWIRKDTGYRRFRNVYEEVARKNGKTTKLSAVGSYLAAGDNEPGAKVYCAATKRDQAREVFDSIAMMANKDKHLNKAMRPQRNIIYSHTLKSPNSQVLLLSKDYSSMDGFNVHGGLVDEIHAHPDSGIWDVLESGRASRRQPLLWGITTSGFNHNSFCYEFRTYGIQILEGTIPESECDSTFVIIYTLDEKDDWQDPNCWPKANPNLGVSVYLNDLKEQCQKAKQMSSAKTEFLTKRLNKWIYSESVWMNMEAWNACNLPSIQELDYWQTDKQTDLDNMPCTGGLDLAAREDLCALSLSFKLPNGKTRMLSRGYLPEYAFNLRMKKGGELAALYRKFRDLGLLIVTPGNQCDYKFIEHDIKQVCERFNVLAIAYDRWNSSQLVVDLIEEGVPMVAMGQGYASISPAMKELLVLVLGKNIEHNNPLLSFAIGNVVAVMNPAGDIKFDKSKVSEKIDPAAAGIMSIGLSMSAIDQSAAIDDFLDDPIKL